MTDTRAGVYVVVAESGANEFLYDVGFFVGASRRGDAANGFAPVLLLNFLEPSGRETDRFVPGDFTPGV
jgi:hypothetical protein